MSNWQELNDNVRLKQIYQTRIKIVRLIREFFWVRGFMETETPIAVHLASQEPYLSPIPVSFHDPYSREERFYLHTSPEYAMKKLLAVGFDKIFQICKTFRDGEEFGGLHNTEFTMIEWYRSPGSLFEIMDDVEELFKFIAKDLSINKLLYRGQDICITGKWNRVSMRRLWQEYLGVELNDYLTIEKIRGLAKEKGHFTSDRDEYEDVFFKIFLNEIEPELGLDKPLFVYDYPAAMCSLSQLSSDDPRYAQRFELYAGGLELANAFGELTDADEQKKRLEKDRELRTRLGKPTWDIDLDFIEALRAADRKLDALHQSMSGVALGVDRVVLLFTGARDIDEVIFQSVSDQLAD